MSEILALGTVVARGMSGGRSSGFSGSSHSSYSKPSTSSSSYKSSSGSSGKSIFGTSKSSSKSSKSIFGTSKKSSTGTQHKTYKKTHTNSNTGSHYKTSTGNTYNTHNYNNYSNGFNGTNWLPFAFLGGYLLGNSGSHTTVVQGSGAGYGGTSVGGAVAGFTSMLLTLAMMVALIFGGVKLWKKHKKKKKFNRWH